MIRIQHILVPVDFSKCSGRAVEFGCHLAEQFCSDLHVLFVREDMSFVFPEPGTGEWGAGEILPNQEDIIQTKLEQIPGEGLCQDTSVVRIVRAGAPFVEITRYAREASIDLIVIGTHGRSGLSHVMMGSVAERVVRSSPCPVLTVTNQSTIHQQPESLRGEP